MSFQVPYSSSPPSTPNRSQNGSRNFFGDSHGSTTPAGPPPPSSAGSFTPAGPPPSSFLGSSTMEPLPTFGNSNAFGMSTASNYTQQSFGGGMNSPMSSPSARSGHPFFAPAPSGLNREDREFLKPSNFFQAPDEEYSDEEYEDEHGHENDRSEERYDDKPPIDERYSDDEMSQDAPYEDDDDGFGGSRYGSNGAGFLSGGKGYGNSLMRSTNSSPRKSTRGSEFGKPMGEEAPPESTYGRIARDTFMHLADHPVEESDNLVLRTEELILRLYDEGIVANDNDTKLHQALSRIPSELVDLWSNYDKITAPAVTEEYVSGIGPNPNASDFARANFIATLLLQLHHPRPTENQENSYARSVINFGSSLLAPPLPRPTPIPQVLLEWMTEFHYPYPNQMRDIITYRPSPASHPNFWDVIYSELLRGRVQGVANALREAGWKNARILEDDERSHLGSRGYSGTALANIEKVIDEAVQLLDQCPAIRNDWNVQGSDWTLFRLRASQASENLKRFSEGRDKSGGVSSAYEAENFGLSGLSDYDQSYTGTARRAESRVPWGIYQNLLALYGLLEGGAVEIVASAEDWTEAAVGLMVWWDEGKDDRQLALGNSHSRFSSSAENMSPEFYLQKLVRCFKKATDGSTDLQVNTLVPSEVALACAFEGDVEAVVAYLRTLSGPIASALVEIASLGGWLPVSEPQSLISMGSLDQDDLAVLGIDAPAQKADGVKDSTLISYAHGLTGHGKMESESTRGQPKTVREGWEVAIEILGRLDSPQRSEEEVGYVLDTLPKDSGATVDRLIRLLNELGMAKLAEHVSEDYANRLAEGTQRFGEALWYYALAHSARKVRDVLDLLISHSLLRSTAFPADSELDGHLERLVHAPKATLTELSQIDYEAGALLHKNLSGYATLRRFYHLRDEEVSPESGKSPQSAIIRRINAATALIAVIASADDNIRGGYYDEEREAVVSVDFLLALLGEALVFVNQPQPTINTEQIYLLMKAIEDLQTVNPRIFTACDEFLKTVMYSTQGLKGSTPNDLLRQSTSGSEFSLVGSSMFASQLQRSMSSSGVMVKGNIKRGWDWRKDISASTTGSDILRILRLGLAKELARVWVLEADGSL